MSGNSCASLPFSISALLTDHPPQPAPSEGNNHPGKSPALAECFPIIFGTGVNLPFGLAQLLAKSGGKGKEEEEQGEGERDESILLEDSEEEREEEEQAGGRLETGQLVHMEGEEEEGEKKPAKSCAGNQPLDFASFIHPGWLFPRAPVPASLARLPCPPPQFSPALLKSPLLSLFSPFPGICASQHFGQSHSAPQSQHKRKGGQIRFSNEQTEVLEGTFDNKKYLTNVERKKVAKMLALTERQVKTWFQNRRAKWRRQLPASSDCLRSPEEEEASAAEQQQMHMAVAAVASRPGIFGSFCGLSD